MLNTLEGNRVNSMKPFIAEDLKKKPGQTRLSLGLLLNVSWNRICQVCYHSNISCGAMPINIEQDKEINSR